MLQSGRESNPGTGSLSRSTGTSPPPLESNFREKTAAGTIAHNAAQGRVSCALQDLQKAIIQSYTEYSENRQQAQYSTRPGLLRHHKTCR